MSDEIPEVETEGQRAQRLRTERLRELDKKARLPQPIVDEFVKAMVRAMDGFWTLTPNPVAAFAKFLDGSMHFEMSSKEFRSVVDDGDDEPPVEVSTGFYL